MSDLRVLIAGSGLGGLVLAQGLRRHGIDVQVFERDTSPWERPQGYRLHLEADGLNAVREVLAPEAAALFDATAMRTTDATTILSPDLDVVKRLPTRDGHDLVFWPAGDSRTAGHRNVDRATLREILLDGLTDLVHFGRRVVAYTSTPDGVSVQFQDGTTASGDVLVGADGVRSAVRAQRASQLQIMDAGVQAIYGKLAWDRAVELLPAAALEDIFSIAMDARKVFLGLGSVRFPTEPSRAATAAGRPGLLSARPDYVVCIVGGRHEFFPLSHGELRTMGPADIGDVARAVMQEWPEATRRVLDAADPSAFFSVGMASSVPGPLDQPTKVTLLGDAVHTMTPTLGRGANLAMRDGALLARHLRNVAHRTATLPVALGAYERELTRYGFHVVRESVTLGGQRMNQNPLPR